MSKTNEDLPEPDTPVTTVSRSCGMSIEMFLRLWTLAPRIEIEAPTNTYCLKAALSGEIPKSASVSADPATGQKMLRMRSFRGRDGWSQQPCGKPHANAYRTEKNAGPREVAYVPTVALN